MRIRVLASDRFPFRGFSSAISNKECGKYLFAGFLRLFFGRFLMTVLLVFAVHVPNLFAQTSALSTFLSADNLRSANISVVIADLETGQRLIEHNAQEVRNPASLTKLLTTASALELLSDTFRFETTVEYDGELRDSVLYGNLFIRGGGDPTLESVHSPTPNNFYVDVLQTLQSKGIKRISGRIVGDASCFQEDGAPFHWLVEDVGSSYSPTPSALSIHDNKLKLELIADSQEVSISKIQPHTGLLSPVLEITMNSAPLAWRVTKTDYSWSPVVRGNLPKNTTRRIVTEIPEPALFAADSLTNLLRMVGIGVDSVPSTLRWMKSAFARTHLYTYYSAPLKDVARVTNHRSDNLYAENIFKRLSLVSDSLSPCLDERSSAFIASYWKKRGLPSELIFQEDGSGLSMKNAITADFFVRLLTYMKKDSRYAESFFSSLPVAGKNGTVASFMRGTKLEGKAFLKSGSMERVQNYAGYIKQGGKWYAFCVMVANYTGKRRLLVKQISTMLNAIFAPQTNK